MKKIILNKLYLVFVLLPLLTLGVASCSDDDDNRSEESFIKISGDKFEINRLGLSQNGDTTLVLISSNKYWKASIISEGDWLKTNILGGSGSSEMFLKPSINTTSDKRTATIKFELLDGTTKQIAVEQTGISNEVVFVKENLDITPSKMLEVNKYVDWNNTATGGNLFKGRGEGVYIDDTNSSTGYDGASGVNNIYFESINSHVTLGHFFTKKDNAFKLRFGAMSTEATFNKSDLILKVSKDNISWQDLPYERKSQEGKWSICEAVFNYDDVHAQLYFKLEAKKAKTFRIDDIVVVENLAREGEKIDFMVYIDDNKPNGFVYFEEDFSWITVGPDFINNVEDPLTEVRFDNKVEQDARDPLQNIALVESGWTWPLAANLIYMHKGYVKIGTSSGNGTLVSPALKTIEDPAVLNVKVTFEAAMYESKDGTQDTPREMYVDIVDGTPGHINNGTSTRVEFLLDTYNNNMKQYSFIIYEATERTQIQFTNWKKGKNRMFLDNVKVVKIAKE